MYSFILGVFRKYAFFFALGVVVVAFSFSYVFFANEKEYMDISKTLPSTGGFYLGFYTPEIQTFILPSSTLHSAETLLSAPFQIVSLYESWGDASLPRFPLQLLRDIRSRGSVPLITWEPWTRGFSQYANDPLLSRDKKVFAGILSGKFDRYIEAYAVKLREFGEPVLIRFAHEPTNPLYPWSSTGGNTSEEYVAAWRYVSQYFDALGAVNVGWVWNPWEEESALSYYPGDEFVDWIGVTALNYGYAALDQKWHEFSEIYQPFHDLLVPLQKPVLLAEFGSTAYGGNRQEWLSNAFFSIQKSFPEIRSIVFFMSDDDQNWATSFRPENGEKTIHWSFKSSSTFQMLRDYLKEPPFSERPLLSSFPSGSSSLPKFTSSSFIQGKMGAFTLSVDNEPFFIKGVAYNPGHDWKNGHTPLTRRYLESDFSLIKKLGANTIRRYGVSPYDRNVLMVADEYGLKVLFGFWFDEKIDYLTESEVLKSYEEEVLDTVEKYRDHPAILAWVLGNEVWGLLKHSYSEPYLTLTRGAYTRFVEGLARKVQEIDPHHPVFSVHEHALDLSGALFDFTRNAPSLHGIGINSYYESDLMDLNHIAYAFNAGRPYFISEFGPDGYWDPARSQRTSANDILEPDSSVKSEQYSSRWEKYVSKNRGYTLGGVAYAWRDRYEGTETWFGLTDLMGRLKPTYYSLLQTWTSSSVPELPRVQKIVLPAEVFLPDVRISAHVVLEEKSSNDLEFTWKILRDDLFVTDEGSISLYGEGERILLQTPKEEGLYRLYVSVSDGKGNMDTANAPFRIAGFSGY